MRWPTTAFPETGFQVAERRLDLARPSYSRASSIAFAAASCIFGSTWLQVSRVMVTLAWPNISDTTFTGTPLTEAGWRTCAEGRASEWKPGVPRA